MNSIKIVYPVEKSMEVYLKFFEPVSSEGGMEMSITEAKERVCLLLKLGFWEKDIRIQVRLFEELFRVVFYTQVKTDPIWKHFLASAYAKMEEFLRKEHKELRHFRVKWSKYLNEGVVTDWVGMDGEDNEKDKNW